MTTNIYIILGFILLLWVLLGSMMLFFTFQMTKLLKDTDPKKVTAILEGYSKMFDKMPWPRFGRGVFIKLISGAVKKDIIDEK